MFVKKQLVRLSNGLLEGSLPGVTADFARGSGSVSTR
jgi:hypothetical protein